VGLALLVVLERLTPAERLAFVLHDMFAVPFEEIALIVGRSAEATRQLASRARRRVRGGGSETASDLAQQREVVDAFLAALRGGIQVMPCQTSTTSSPLTWRNGAMCSCTSSLR